ncbi:MAG: four helix bundle protein [Bacteroidota bacterium]
MKPNIVKDKSFLFAKRIVFSSKFLIKKNEFVLSKLLLRSGTAPGALIREAEMAESKKDFIHKLCIALKEANETEYWIDLLMETEYLSNKNGTSLKTDCIEIFKLLTSIIKSSKS